MRQRCECKVGDVPHPEAIAHKRVHSRCTRTATTEIRRVGSKGGWYAYCAGCADAIRAYQGADVEYREMRPTP